MSTQPVALYAAKVPPGGVLIPAAVGDKSPMFRVTMAAIDPDAMPEFEDNDATNKPVRATLKIVRPPPGLDLDDDDSEDEDEDEDDDEDEDEDESSDDESNGGPSDPAKLKKAREAAAKKELDDAMDEDEDESDGDDDVDLKAAISKLVKGKARATSEDGSEDSDGLEMEELVVCTLDPEKNLQQAVDFVVAEDERIFFKVTGTHAVYLTGNYVIPADDHPSDDESDEEDDGDYDLPPDEDELELLDDDEESDELDDVENPRVTEVDSDEEEVPKLIAAEAKSKNKKRRAADSDEEAGNLDDMIAKSNKTNESAANGEPKLSKKQQKKLKKNNGEAAEVQTKTAEAEKEAPTTAKTDKKVQFAKNLEQGPSRKEEDKPAGKTGVREVQGVAIDDRTPGKGRAAKKGDQVAMRYIGKLENGKVFDANKKGKPFSFKLGSGEVIKGWDIGVAGLAIGGERRVTIPPHLAYGKQSLPGIPSNSKLIFDIKLLDIK